MPDYESLQQLRTHAREILSTALQAADPEEAVRRHVKVRGHVLSIGPDVDVDLSQFDRIFVVGAGKGSAPMAKAVEDLFGERIDAGVVCVKYGYGTPLKRVRIMEAGHPLPDEAGEEAGRTILRILESAGARDLVVACISGGASALLPVAADGITLEDKQRLTQRLLACGADIHEINAVRKHLSAAKGGRLMQRAYPASVINLMLSDVVGDDPDVIGSGPFYPDASTFVTAVDVLKRYDLEREIPDNVAWRLSQGTQGRIPDTPKKNDPIFDRAWNAIIGSNLHCLQSARSKAQDLGYRSLILSSRIQGEARDAAGFHAALAHEVRDSGNPVDSPACLLSGGETTVVVKGPGLGGRNQHFALSLIREASKISQCLFLSAGTDGTDGPTDAAGAMVDTDSLGRALGMGLDPDKFLDENDSYHFFQKLGDLVITGPTRTNVMDVRIVLVG
jgi:glycerate 2-kinase